MQITWFDVVLIIYLQSDKSKTSIFATAYRGSENSPLLIVFSAYYIDQSNRDFYFGSFDFFIWVDYMPKVTVETKRLYCTA